MANKDKPQVTASSNSNTPLGEEHGIASVFGRKVPLKTRALDDDIVALGDEAGQSNNHGRDEANSHLVILVHGINTRALWMGEIKPALEAAGFAVAPTSFGKFGVLPFLMPFAWGREGAIRRVAMDVQTARRVYKLRQRADPERMSVISHSFGTYVVSRILTDYSEFKWHRVIFCGSVVREDFRFDHVLERFDPPLLNEVGTKDFWPAVAESAGWGYGSVGSTGFHRPPVDTRWHKGYRHSDFLTEQFCTKYWIPFLRGQEPRRGDRAAHMPFLITLITWLPLRWLPVVFLVGMLLSVALLIAPISRIDPDKLDPLKLFYGRWISTDPPGEQLIFSSNPRERWLILPGLGQAAIFPSDGREGSNLRILGQGYQCYYYVNEQNNAEMTWEFKSGDPQCPQFKRLSR